MSNIVYSGTVNLIDIKSRKILGKNHNNATDTFLKVFYDLLEYKTVDPLRLPAYIDIVDDHKISILKSSIQVNSYYKGKMYYETILKPQLISGKIENAKYI